MRWHWLTLTAGIVAGTLTLLCEVQSATATGSERLSLRQREVARLRAHFDSVDAELRHAALPSLTLPQQAARETLIVWLRDYRTAGRFPRNEYASGPALPFFRDSLGTLCAMAYVIDRSGRGDLIARIAETHNNAFIADPASDVEPFVANYDSAWSRRDTTAVSRLLSPRYLYFSSRGEVSSRAETMAMLSDSGYRLAHATRSEIAVSQTGPVAVVSSRWQGRGSYRGQRFKDDQRCGQTWMLADDIWQLLSEHCVQIAPVPGTDTSE